MESPDFIKVVEINHQKCIDLNHLWKAIGMPSLNHLQKRISGIKLKIHQERDQMGVLLKDGFALIAVLEDYLAYLEGWDKVVFKNLSVVTIWIGNTLCIDINPLWKNIGFESKTALKKELETLAIKLYSDGINQGINLTAAMIFAKAIEVKYKKAILLYTTIRNIIKSGPRIGYHNPDDWMVLNY